MHNRRLSVLLFAGFVAGAGCSEGQSASGFNRDDQHARLPEQGPPLTRLCEDACRKVPARCREADCARECAAGVTERCERETRIFVQCVAYRGSVECEAVDFAENDVSFSTTISGCDAEQLAFVRCIEDDIGQGGVSGRGGAAGTDGFGGTRGDGGTTGFGGTAGVAGSLGTGGVAGSLGTGGVAGSLGTGGVAGSLGTGGVAGSFGTGGVAGSLGTGGVIGTGGTGGFDAGPDATGGTLGSGGSGGTGGQCAFPDCTGCADACQTCLCNDPSDSGICALECSADSGADTGSN